MPNNPNPDTGGLLPPPVEMPEVEVRPARPPAPMGSEAGWGGAPAGALNIASGFMEGWLRGKHLTEQRSQAKALSEISGGRQMFTMAVQGYRDFMSNPPPTDPQQKQQWEQKKDQLYQAVVGARNYYSGLMEKHAFPEEQQAKGVGGKLRQFGRGVKREMTPQPAQLFAQTAMNAFKSLPVEALLQPSPEDRVREAQLENLKAGTEAERTRTESEKERIKTQQFELGTAQEAKKNTETWASLRAKPRTPEEDRQYRELSDKLGKDEAVLARNDLMRKIMGGGGMSPGERSAAQAFGLLQPDNSGMIQDASGMWYMVKVSPDGKISKQSLGIKGQLPHAGAGTPGYFEAISGLAKAYRAADPTLSQQEAMNKGLAAFSQAPQPGNLTGPALASKLSRAIYQVYNATDPKQREALRNYFDVSKGYYGLKQSPDQPETGILQSLFGFEPKMHGLTRAEVEAQEPAVRAALAEKLEALGVPPEQVQNVLEAHKTIGSQMAGQKPEPVQRRFKIVGQDGKTIERTMSDQQARELGSRRPDLKMAPADPSSAPPPGFGGATP